MELTPVLTILCAYLTLTRAECFFPGRTVADRDVPCNSGPGQSACCSPDATCLANGACLNGGRLSRGSCTDIDWKSSACFGHCRQLNKYEGAIVIPCFSNNGDWLFACGYGNCGTANFTMTSSLANELVLRPTQLSSAVTAAGSSFATGPTPTEATSNASTSASQPDDSEYTAGEMAGVGVGVGVPLLIIIGVLSWLLCREKRRSGRGNGNSYAAVAQGSPRPMAKDQAPPHMYNGHAVQSQMNSAELAVKTTSQELAVEAR